MRGLRAPSHSPRQGRRPWTLLLAAALAALLGPTASATAQHAHHAAPSGAMAASPAPQRAWTDLPLLQARPDGRAAVTLKPVNLAPTQPLAVTAPNGDRWTEAFADGQAAVVSRANIGNYHWAVAMQDGPDGLRIAAAALYFSNPGPAPTKILAQAQAPLEIIPDPLPREHWRWRAGESGRFLVRADGVPVPGAKLRFETSNGARMTLTADGRGVVEAIFPNDFAPVDQRPAPSAGSGGGHGRRLSAGFVLATEQEQAGRRIVSAFNGLYEPSALDGKSRWAGLGFALFGAACALPLLRRRAHKEA